MNPEQELFEESLELESNRRLENVNVNQLILIRKKILVEMENILSKIINNASITYPIMESDEATERLKSLAKNDVVDIVEQKLKYNALAEDYFLVENLIEEHNQNAIIEHEGRTQTINQALRFNKLAKNLSAKSYISEKTMYEILLKSAKSKYINNGNKVMREEPNFNPDDITVALRELNKTTDTLSLKIDELNNRTTFRFENAYKYLDL